jgi:mannosyltransferase
MNDSLHVAAQLKNRQWLMLVVLWLASALRWGGLGRQSIAFDESFSLAVGQAGWSTLFEAILSDGVHPPLFYVIHKLALATFGISEFGQRFPAALFSILAVAMVYRAGKVIFSRRVGLWAAILLAINPLQVWLAQEARMYTLFTLLTIASMFFFWQAIQSGRFWAWLGLALTHATLFLIHYFSFLVPTIQFVFLILTFSRNHHRLRLWALTQFVAAIPLLPWLFVTAMRPAQTFGIGFLLTPTSADLLLTYLNLYMGSSFLWWPIVMVGVMAVMIILAQALRKVPPHKYLIRHGRLLLLLWLLLPPLITWLVSQRRSFYADRYLSFAIPGLLLLMAYGIDRAGLGRSRWLKLVVLLLLLANGYGLWAIRVDQAYQKDDWRGAAALVAENQQPGDVLLLYTTHIKFAFDYYYPGPLATEPISLNQELFPIEPLVTGHDRAWIVYPYTRRPTHYPMQPVMPDGFWAEDPARNPRLVSWLAQHQHKVIEYHHFRGIELWLVEMEKG